MDQSVKIYADQFEMGSCVGGNETLIKIYVSIDSCYP